MHKVKKIAPLVVGSILIISLSINLFLYLNYLKNDSIDYRKRYGIYVTMAESLWNKKNGGDSDLDIRNPVGITFPDKVCVSLSLQKGAIGGVPVYCFRIEDKKLIEKYDDVE